jgi:hypothetical protein
VERGQRMMPSQSSGEPDGWWVFTSGDLELYTGTSLLWLGQPGDAQPHVREALSLYQAVPVALQSPADQAQAQINLAICLAHQDEPDEGIRLVTDALAVNRECECNVQQVGEFLTALRPVHRDLPAARALAEQLRTLRASRPGPGHG